MTPKLSTTTPPKGVASLSTMNAATMRLCRADLPASARSSRLEAAPTALLPCKAGRRRRQGYLRNKAHPEPLRSPRRKAGLPDFGRQPAIRQGLTGTLSMTRLCAFVEEITLLPRAIQSRLACPGPVTERPLPQRSSSHSLALAEKEGHLRGRSRWFVHDAGKEKLV